MKKSTAILWIAVMGIIAAVFCILFISGSIRNDALIEEMKGKSVNQAARIMELDANNAEKDTLIDDLSAESMDQASRIEALNLEISEQKTAMEQKESELAALKGESTSRQEQIEKLQAELAEKLNISLSHMSDIETGKSNYGVDILMRITEVLPEPERPVSSVTSPGRSSRRTSFTA